MLKMLVQVRKKSGMTDAAFQRCWEKQHGPLVRELAHDIGIRRYVQSHRLPSADIDAFATDRGWCPAPDGQAEIWWQDIGAMQQALASAAGQAASQRLEADEKTFTDSARLSAFLAREETIFDFNGPAGPGPQSVKMVVEVWKLPHMSYDAFGERWRVAHGNLVRRHARAMGFTKYVQSHRDQSAPFDFAAQRGWMPAPDGITEVWWESVAAMQAAFAAPAAAEASAELAADEVQFIDSARISAFLATEKLIFDFTAA